MAIFTEVLRKVLDLRNASQRTVVPGNIVVPGSTAQPREQVADFQPGIADLVAGVAVPQDQTPDAAMLTITGGGFFLLLPTRADDEVLGLVCDRPSGEWRSNRTSGLASLPDQNKSLSDVMLTPFAITAPSGAPSTWDGLVIGGPAGVAIEVSALGEVTVTGPSGSTITMDVAGSVTIEVAPGQSVNAGGPAAVALHKAELMEIAIDLFLKAGMVAGTGAPGSTGTLAFTAAQGAWNASKLGGALRTLKAKGE